MTKREHGQRRWQNLSAYMKAQKVTPPQFEFPFTADTFALSGERGAGTKFDPPILPERAAVLFAELLAKLETGILTYNENRGDESKSSQAENAKDCGADFSPRLQNFSSVRC